MVFAKYNTLAEFHEFLKSEATAGTADTYTKAIDFLLADQLLMDCKQLDVAKVMQKLERVKYKSYYSKYKNAFLKFADFVGIELSDQVINQLNLMQKSKTKKYRKLKPTKLVDIKKTTDQMKDKKLKLSFETMFATGLRVSELSQIKKEDCQITEDHITFNFSGKGERKERVIIRKSEHSTLFANLLKLIDQTGTDKKLFYSAGYLQTQAKEKGFQCHDLRRAFSKLEYSKHGDIEKVMKSLRHRSKRTTEVYLHSKVQI